VIFQLGQNYDRNYTGGFAFRELLVRAQAHLDAPLRGLYLTGMHRARLCRAVLHVDARRTDSLKFILRDIPARCSTDPSRTFGAQARIARRSVRR
jgi:hypothetical protein